MAKSLNKKNGNLRGVSGAYWDDKDTFDYEPIQVQGWAVHIDDGYGFNLIADVGESGLIEITLNEAAIERLLFAVDALQYGGDV